MVHNVNVHTFYHIHLFVEISDERAQTIINKALERSSLNERNIIAVITGLMGAGKTWLLSRLFHKPPPERYTSTGIAEKSYQGLLHYLGSIESWDLLSDNDLCEVLAPFLRAETIEADMGLLAANLIATDRSDEATSTSLASLPTATLPLVAPPSTPPVPIKPLSMPKESSTKKAMVSEVKETTDSKKELTLELVNMIDTGGQPELMEVMPSLIHNANLAVLVLNLMYGLDEYPPIDFHVEGKGYKREMLSQYSGRQIIMKLASTLQAKKSCHKAGTIFRLLVVATHRDQVGDLKAQEAKVNTLNRELSRLLLPAFKEELILFQTPNKIAFVLNLKKPDDTDEERLQLIRAKINDPTLGTVFKVPSAFFMLQQFLREVAAFNKRDILSLDECVQIGKELKMNDEVVKAALVLFHRQNTFLYYRHVLPYHVFIKPQLPFDFVNNVVRFSYKVCDEGLQGVPASFVSSLKEGIITREIISHKELSSLFIPGFYEPEHAIKLFCHTFTIAPLSHEQQQLRPGKKPHVLPKRKEEYLMMCLLPATPEHELPQYIPSDTMPLVVTFSRDCVPLSCFSSTISCLLSTYQWTISKKDADTKECLSHNIVSLRNPEMPVKIVLVDATTHIKVYIDSSKEHSKILPKVCSRVRKTVFGAIEKVLEVMRLSEIGVLPAVKCPCKKISETHFAAYHYSTLLKKDYLRCSKNDREEEMTDDKHKMWFGATLGEIHITSTPHFIYTLQACTI